VVGEGELLTVPACRGYRKQPLPHTPEKFHWELNKPLPDEWHIGRLETILGEPAVRTAPYRDPYYSGTVMSQIRSDKQWSWGFFRLEPDSLVRVRYRVDTPGDGQLCFCARTPDPRSPATGMLEWNGRYDPPADGKWGWLEVRAEDMLRNRHAPAFGPPWIGFLVIFNTYAIDLGLAVAEFRVSPPGRPAHD